MLTVQFYTRQGCHLCEVMLEQLMPMLRGHADIDIRDVDTVTEWREKYGTRVPVLEVSGMLICDYPLDRSAVDQFIAELPENGPEVGILRR